MLQLFIASFCDQTDIEGNGSNMTNAKKLKQQALLKLKKGDFENRNGQFHGF